MIDFNLIISTALRQAVDDHLVQIRQEYANKMGEMAERIALLEEKAAVPALTRLEVEEIAGQAAEQVMDSHCRYYDHDQFINDLSSIRLSDHFDIEDEITEVVRNMSFEVTVC